VLPPGSETALFVGSTSGNSWSSTRPADGDYTVRVYLMRSAARRNEKAKYTLSINITDCGLGRVRLKVWFGVSVEAALAAIIAAKAAPTEKIIALNAMKTLLLIAPVWERRYRATPRCRERRIMPPARPPCSIGPDSASTAEFRIESAAM